MVTVVYNQHTRFPCHQEFTEKNGTMENANSSPGPSAETCRGFLPYEFGGFCREFSWRIFLGTFSRKKMRRKNPATKSAKTSGGQIIKVREKFVLPKSDPKTCKFPRIKAATLRSAPSHAGSPRPFGPKTLEEAEKSPEIPPGTGPQSPERVHPGVSKESKKSLKVRVLDSSRTLLRLRGALIRALGVPTRCGAGPIATVKLRVIKIRNSGPRIIGARKGIPKNLSSQVFGEVRVNFLG